MCEDVQPEEVLDLWFSSDAWKQISDDSEKGCKDSIELMERVNDQLGNLIFHLSNESNEQKILYEIKFFVDLCNDFDIINE